jgi:sporulation protein YlmC with PRC-barrel domain
MTSAPSGAVAIARDNTPVNSFRKDTPMTVKFILNDKGNPVGKLADAELHFTDGPLDGLKLIGFAVWERRTGGGRNVTFPARQYSVNGERRSFSLLRPAVDNAAQDRIRDLVLDAYAAFIEENR